MASWTTKLDPSVPKYEKILKDVVEEFIGIMELEYGDYSGVEFSKQDKKEITEHFDKFFKDPEFDRLITKILKYVLD